MKLLCKLFGHQPPVYAEKGWYSPGEEYARVALRGKDGLGTVHADVVSECPRCGVEFKICRIHIPKNLQINRFKKKEPKVHLSNDLYAQEFVSGGFVLVQLRDNYDGDQFQLAEDEIVSLSKFLNQVVERRKL